MKTIISTLMILVLMAGIIVACKPVSSEQIEIIGEQDAGSTIELSTGDTLFVSLDGNITTGFNWMPAAQNPALLEQVGEAEVNQKDNQFGAPGRIVLRFKATAKGQTILHLEYRRSWEEHIEPEKTFDVTVVVNE